MRTLLVITTKDFPHNQETILCSDDLEKIITDKIMVVEEDCDNSIDSYLKSYYHPILKDEVKKYLEGLTSLPIVKRVVGDEYYLYIAPCISADVAPKGGVSGHNYIAQLIRFAKKNMNFQDESDRLFVIAHDKDLCKEGKPEENNRFLSSQELKGMLAELIKEDKQVYIFQHKNGLEVYENLIGSLMEEDKTLEDSCKRIVLYLELS